VSTSPRPVAAPGPAAVDVVAHRHATLLPLLADAALPAVREARRHGVHAHVERHWRRGPHLRVRLSGDPEALRPAAALVRDALAGHVAAHPARPDATPAELLARAAAAGRAELDPGPYGPVRPDGTVLAGPADPAEDARLARLLGGPGAVAVRAALLAAGTDALAASARVLLAAPAAAAASDARVRVALAAVTAHAARFPTGAVDGHHTFRSHVEEFLHLHDPGGRVRARLDAQWLRHGDRVTAEVGRVVTAGPDGATGRAWAEWADRAWLLCPPAQARGELPAAPGDEYRRRAAALDPATATAWDPAARTYSDYHLGLRLVDYARGREGTVASYRFATNVLYRLLLLCEVTPLERLLAAHLLARAVTRLAGLPWDEPTPVAPAPAVRHPAGRSTRPPRETR
jgi:hypothetical protein